MKNIEFQLLGKIDKTNPSSISSKQILQWEKEGILTYLGQTNDIRKYIANATCIVLPSYREGVPRVLLEAMAMQKPFITTNTPGCKECLIPDGKKDELIIGKNGILCNPKDIKSLKKAIDYFINLKEEDQIKMGNSNIEFIKNFDIDHVIKIYQSKLNPQTPIIAFVSNTSFGMYNFRLEVLKALQKSGFIIHILSPKDEYSAKLCAQGFIHHPINMDSKGLNPLKDFKTFLQIRKILKSIYPSMVFNYTIKPVIYASFACYLLKIPNINLITGLGYVFINTDFKTKFLRFLVSKMYQVSLKKSSEVWFLNPDDKKEFTKRKIISPSKAFLLNSEGINLEHFAPMPTTSQDKIIFLLPARMLWDKGVGEFAEVASSILCKTNSKPMYTTGQNL